MLLEIVVEAVESAHEELKHLPYVRADKIGLDPRAGYVWVDQENDIIVCNDNSRRTLDYYGGFEYVDSCAVTKFGDLTIYSGYDDERVCEAIEYYDELAKAEAD